MKRRPDQKRTASLIRSTVVAWDLVYSLVGAGLFFGFAAGARSFEGDRSLLLAAVPAQIALGTAALVAVRSLTERLADDEYGEVVGLVDPSEDAARLPFLVVIYVALLGAAAAGVGAVVLENLKSQSQRAAISAVVVGLVMWTFLGVLSLVRIWSGHSRRQARLRHLKERLEAAERDCRATRDERRDT